MTGPTQTEPAIIVIFGITGDLVKRKLFPALFNLMQAGLLHEETVILGVTRQNIDANEMVKRLTDGNSIYDDNAIELIRRKLMMQTMNITEGSEYDKLLKLMNDIEETLGSLHELTSIIFRYRHRYLLQLLNSWVSMD